ncbi:8801_t:CDS:2, partial [Gigaspora margarita]
KGHFGNWLGTYRKQKKGHYCVIEIVLNIENFKNILKIAYLNALNKYHKINPNEAIDKKEIKKNLWKQKKSIKFLAFVKTKFGKVDGTNISRAISSNVPISISNVPTNAPIFNEPTLVLIDESFNPNWSESVKQRIFELEKTLN